MRLCAGMRNERREFTVLRLKNGKQASRRSTSSVMLVVSVLTLRAVVMGPTRVRRRRDGYCCGTRERGCHNTHARLGATPFEEHISDWRSYPNEELPVSSQHRL